MTDAASTPWFTIVSNTLLSDNWYILRKVVADQRCRDGTVQRITREVYDRGNGATILLYDRTRRVVVLTRQLRLPTYLNGNADGFLIETPAGLLDDLDPDTAIAKEAMEETGYRVASPRALFDLYMSPGAVTERVHFFAAEIVATDRETLGGGLADEAEDIEVLELGFEEALAMIDDGRIRDAKTVILLQWAALNRVFDV